MVPARLLMKTLISIGVLFVTIGALAIGGCTSGDDAQVAADLAAEWAAGWASDDGARVASVFTPDGIYINPLGQATQGRNEIEA